MKMICATGQTPLQGNPNAQDTTIANCCTRFEGILPSKIKTSTTLSAQHAAFIKFKEKPLQHHSERKEHRIFCKTAHHPYTKREHHYKTIIANTKSPPLHTSCQLKEEGFLRNARSSRGTTWMLAKRKEAHASRTCENPLLLLPPSRRRPGNIQPASLPKTIVTEKKP